MGLPAAACTGRIVRLAAALFCFIGVAQGFYAPQGAALQVRTNGIQRSSAESRIGVCGWSGEAKAFAPGYQALVTSSTSSVRRGATALNMVVPSSNPIVFVAGIITGIQRPVAVAAIKAVVKLVSSCSIGYMLSKKGILDQAALTSLSKLIFFVFQPCLLFVNVAHTLANSGQSLSKLAVLPIFACLQIAVAAVFAAGIGRAIGFKPQSEEGREVKMCASFANSGPLPLLFVDSLFGHHADVTLLPTAVAYISFYLLGWSPMFWTAGYNILAGRPPPASPLPAALEDGNINNASSSPRQQRSPLKKAIIALQSIRHSPTFKRIASPPVLGCLAGAVVGLAPPLRYLLVGRHAPLSPVFDSLKALGAAYLPAAILVLAGSLARPSDKAAPKAPFRPFRPFMDAKFRKKLLAIMGCRFLLMPATAAALLVAGSRIGLIPYDRLLWFVLLMEGCMPSAQNSVVILQMEKEPAAAASMARTLTAIYLLSALPIAALLSAILQFVAL